MKKLKEDVERILNSPEILEKARNSSKGVREYLAEYLNYFLLMENEDGVDEYMASKDKEDYAIKRIAEKLGVDLNTDDGKDKIAEYIFQKRFGSDAVVFHTTTSVALDEIKKFGMDPKRRLWDVNELNKVYNILMNAPNPVDNSLQIVVNDGERWFYDESIINMMSYANSPEWMKMFFGEKIYSSRDRDAAMQLIDQVIEESGLNGDEYFLQEFTVRNFLEKSWDRYEKATPRLLIIPKEAARGTKLEYQNIKEILTEEGGNTFEFFKSFITSYEVDENSTEVIPPDQIESIRLTKLFPSKDITSDIELVEQIYLGGTGKMYLAKNVNQDEFIFKPGYRRYTNEYDGFKVSATIAGSKIQSIIDPQSAIKCQEITLDGMPGTVQEKIKVDQEKTKALRDFQDGIGELDEQTLKQLMREYVTDYLLCNYDSHCKNFIVGEDGILRGVDKEQSFKYIQEDGSENPDFSINFNARYNEKPSIYSVIFQRIREGKISPDILNYMDEYVERISNYPDEEYYKIVEPYTRGFVIFGDSDEEGLVALDFTKCEKIFDLITKRKVEIREVMAKLKTELREKYMESTTRKGKEEYDMGSLINCIRGVDPAKRMVAQSLVQELEGKEFGIEQEDDSHDEI